MNDFFHSPVLSKLIAVLSVILIALVTFQAGVIVGYRRGNFAANWDMARERPFTDPRSIFAPFMGRDRDDVNPHGAVGEIISRALPNIMIKGPGAAEEIVHVSPTTTLRYMHEVASTSALTVGSQVVIIGEPGSDGRLNASFIRIMPALQRFGPVNQASGTGSTVPPLRPQ